jgi:hypothetical protein
VLFNILQYDKNMSRIIEDDSKSISLKKRWLAHHHDDQQQVNDQNNPLEIDQLMRKYDFHDWQTITVLVQINSNEYISGKISQIGLNGCLNVQTNNSSIEINVCENIFGILSDNAPSIQDLTKGKFILCKNDDIYQTAVIMNKTNDGKFEILFQKHKEIFSVPRQSIRLFLPPWHDGPYPSFLFPNLIYLFILEIPIDWNAAFYQTRLFTSNGK